MKSVNPATGQTLREYEEMSVDDARATVDAAHEAWQSWRSTSFNERASVLRRAAQILEDRSRKFGELMTREMGKLVADGVSEAEKCAWVCRHYAEHAERYLTPETVESDASKSYIAYEPLGVLLAVMPWNFPFWQVFRFAAPALMAGNAGVLKHASNVPGCALAIEGVFREAGLPENVFRTLLIGSSKIDDILAYGKIRSMSLTGSTPAGKKAASTAAAQLVKTVLELGGSDAYVVLQDADLEPTLEICVKSRLICNGQSCIAAKRFIVVREVLDAFVEGYVERMRAVTMGDPMDQATGLGPLAREDLRETLHNQVKGSIVNGATCLVGGEIPGGQGWFYPATVLTDVRPGMVAYEEELFGPVAAIIAAEDEDDAVRIANDSPFGLGAAVFTRDTARGEAIAAHRLEAGSCFVNAYVRSDPRLPFGGVRDSGYGRELGRHGIQELVNIKTVYVA